MNSQSLNNKISTLIQFLEDNSIDICLLTETWLKTQNNFVTALLKEAGYKITHCVRQNKKGGGVAIVSKHIFETKYEKSEFQNKECVL